jgi:hypothetical protein
MAALKLRGSEAKILNSHGCAGGGMETLCSKKGIPEIPELPF